ncbi:carboxypeptidase-like regulatory domain-containing protein [Flavobacterium hungaricum]|uniref:Carboxypeptidase regulatory-like domain-containing protein n=1 Tax=Flavobacterium hungaricum TaxID=2082725 RepID=A0ABR9TLZ7_9FLAO|nr:carboxypeptidase-like regulatory domain-containing protein [Flavobacterium hungaricum]MBE8725662.1 carboxypeptidase regulatory-like domain-containing protein [Flavobacterium hungaricum]
MKLILSLIVFVFSSQLFSQNQNNLKSAYSEEVKKDSIKMIENKTIGYSDSFTKIKGKTSDHKSFGVGNVNVTLTNLATKATTSCETNEDGLYDIEVERGSYSIAFFQRSYGKFEIEKINLNDCQIQEININLGSRIKVVHHFIVSAPDITLPSKKKKKRQKISKAE